RPSGPRPAIHLFISFDFGFCLSSALRILVPTLGVGTRPGGPGICIVQFGRFRLHDLTSLLRRVPARRDPRAERGNELNAHSHRREKLPWPNGVWVKSWWTSAT